jgi:hypothetical protein
MVSSIINVIGVVAGVLGIWGFAEDHVPPKAQPEKPDDPNRYITTVRVTAGLDGSDNPMTTGGGPRRLLSAGGRLGSMIHYNRNGDVLGAGSSVHRIEDGAFIDFKSPSSNGSQPVTTEIRGTDDSICIATLTTTWPDDLKFGWTGDVSTNPPIYLGRNSTDYNFLVGQYLWIALLLQWYYCKFCLDFLHTDLSILELTFK